MATIVTTWPLAAHLTGSLPIDLGDSLLNCWILSWGAGHVLAWLGGNFDAFHNYWQAPIFHPSPLALAYSEHLFAQAVQIAPIYAVTGNIILCYNLLFLSTFVLSGLGTYLLVRELTGHGTAAWVAGACYAFALYRLPQSAHVQVLSSQWLPFALYGLRRFFVTLRPEPLAGATLALVAQNLSCGYFLIFFSPFVALYCVYELIDRGLWRSARAWAGLATAATVTVVVTWPFLKPYLLLRALGFPPRPLSEVIGYSADVLGFLTTSAANRVWGGHQVFGRSEGEAFPGIVVPVLAAIGIAARIRTVTHLTTALRPDERWRRVALPLVLGGCAAAIVFALVVGATGGTVWHILGTTGRQHVPRRAWALAAVLAAAALALSPRLRGALRGVPGSAVAFFAFVALAASLLAMGPVVTLGGSWTTLPALYAPLYWHVPGFDGLRVPARYAMLSAFALSVVAGFGARALASRGRHGRVALAVLTTLFLVESTGMPITLDARRDAGSRARGPERVYVGDEVPDIYRFASTLAPGSVLIEFPFGPAAWDLQSVFYQPSHHLPIVNGYSGGFPPWYDGAVAAFRHITDAPASAWAALRRTGASHAIVHRQAYRPVGAEVMDRWLTSRGATLARVAGDDWLYALPPP